MPVSYNILSAAPYALNANSSPPGSNDWNCKPTAAHPQPVILVNGTFATMGENWAVISPALKNAGFCVFAFNYGATWITTLTLGHISSINHIDQNAAELSTFVNKVLAATKASKVDLVGHSQGGMMPNYYLKFLNGAAKVNALVGLAPSNHGTTLDGIVTCGMQLGTALPTLMPFISTALAAGGIPAAADQMVGSAFMKKMATKPDTVPGVKYTVISTKYDEVVTPYTSQFLSGSNVTNIVLQNQCSLDHSEHVSIAFDHIATQDVLNALDPAHAKTPVCSSVLPLIGG
ncbi:MAG: alpha/beta fold hydrolase [Actinobacteria bacterium]|nr:alpha/beta fold hydrolase [Actinomycetota bacterium]